MPVSPLTRCLSCGMVYRPDDVAGMSTCPVCGASFQDVTPSETSGIQHTALPAPAGKSRKGIVILICLLVILLYVASSQLTLFVVQPIGAVPEGRTIVIPRLNKTNFIDSADAMCERATGSVNLLCRGMMLGAVANKSEILLRLPYSDTLYLISTGGKHYER